MDLEQIPLSDELLRVMRRGAELSQQNGEMFVTPRSLMLALLDDPSVGPAIAPVVSREKLNALPPPEHELGGMIRVSDERLAGEVPALVRYNTLAFKTPNGKSTLWLNKESLDVFMEGAQRVSAAYLPKHLAMGFAAEAIRMPGVLAAIRVEPGRLTDAIYRL